MDQQETSFIIYEGVVVPESVLLKRERSNRYGSVEDLPDEELVDPKELERCILRNEWGPVLFLPKSKSKGFNPAWDWSVDVDFNAFASVDFERTQPKFNKARYKADKLKEQLKDLLILRAIVSDRIPDENKNKLLTYVKSGIIEVDDIRDWDMWQLAKLYKRALGLARQIIEIREVSKRRK